MEKFTAEEMKELKALANDVLGDLMELRAYTFLENTPYGTIIAINYPALVYAPMEIVRDDWRRATQGTKFESVRIFEAR